MDAPNSPVRRRRWLSFSLRALLLATTVFAVWLGFKVAAARRQHAAVEAILATGGTVLYDYQRVGTGTMIGFDKNAKFPIPVWLRSIAGDDFFVTPLDITLDGGRINDELVANCAAALPNLTALRIKNGTISDAAIRSIGKLQKLEWLDLIGVTATVNDLDGLNSLKSVKGIRFFRNPQSERVEDTLNTPTFVEFGDTPLVEVVKYLSDKHNLKIKIEASPEDAKLEPSVTFGPMSKRLRETLAAALMACKLNYVIRMNESGVTITSPVLARQNWPGFDKLSEMFPNLVELQADW